MCAVLARASYWLLPRRNPDRSMGVDANLGPLINGILGDICIGVLVFIRL